MGGELFLSVDVEADGPIPGPHSMLSFAVVAFDVDGTERGTFSANLDVLEGASPDPDTAKWWERQPEAWAACRKDTQPPEQAMRAFCAWVDKFRDKGWRPVMVAAPAGFDFVFMYWYMMRFAGYSPVGFSCIDMRSFVMGSRRKPFFQTSKRFWPRRWFRDDLPHTHVAEDDAREQGVAFISALKENRGTRAREQPHQQGGGE